jgi:hypothetical protein
MDSLLMREALGAAVDLDQFTGGVPGSGRTKEQSNQSDIFGFTDVTDWNLVRMVALISASAIIRRMRKRWSPISWPRKN